MSEYSESFEESEDKYENEDFAMKSSGNDSNHKEFEENLKVLRDEIKALEIEQLQNIETFESGGSMEIVDDSSEDDMAYIKKRQIAAKKKNKSKVRSKSRQTPAIIQKSPTPKLKVLKNESFSINSQGAKKYSYRSKDFKLLDNGFFFLKPKQIVSAIPDLRYIKKRNEDLKPLKINKALESFDREKALISGPDWKNSVLESFVNSGLFEFNWEKDSEILSEEHILYVSSNNISASLMKKTMKRLCKELLFEGKLNPATLRVDLQRLLMVRRSVICILREIHEREDLLLAILTLGKEAGSELINMNQKLFKLSKSILRNIQKCKDSILGLTSFVYFGEDYLKKMQEDEKRVSRIVGI